MEPDEGNEEEKGAVPMPAEDEGNKASGATQEDKKEAEKNSVQTSFKVQNNEDSGTVPVLSSKSAMSVDEWLGRFGWKTNPFTFSINPELFVGYEEQMKRIVNSIKEKHKISLVIGPTGSGKTSFLRKIEIQNRFQYIYVGKPPAGPEEFVKIFNEKFRAPWYLRWLIPNIKNIYQIPDFLNRKMKNSHLILLFDEAHEAEIDILEWLRVLSDQVDSMSIVMSGLPVFEDRIRTSLESLHNRVAAKVELISLTKEETAELIRKRIRYAGGAGDEPFNQRVIDMVYSKTIGYPREVIRLCDRLMNEAMERGETTIATEVREPVITKEAPSAERMSMLTLEKMTPMQRTVIEMLVKPLTPGQIADALGTMKYKTRQHAVRSVNNILVDLMKERFVERRRRDRAYVYELSAGMRSLIAKS